MADKTGQQVGSYRLVRLLGKGGFAEVYLGQHVRVASKQAAVKILYLYDVDVQKFHEEAEITEQLVHPHIVRLLDYDLHEETPFLVLDYASGGSLRNRHPKGSQVPLDIVVVYLNEIASALQYAHDRHILHRDIKPDNMLIGRQGELLLSDFGIAQLSQTGRSSIEASFVTGGTPFYMAPEMFRGKPEKASDQYSLAVVVYEWLCGTVPFSGGNFIQLGYQHTHEPVPPLRDKNPAVPFAVEQVIMKALAKDPKDRYPEVQNFAEDLEKASIVTQRVTQTVKPAPRNSVPSPVVSPVPPLVRPTQTQKPPQPVQLVPQPVVNPMLENVAVQAVRRNWWLLALRGVFAIIFGLIALFAPGIALLAFIIVFAVYAIIDGIAAVVIAIQERGSLSRWGWVLFEGIIGILAGIVAFVYPGLTALVLLYIIAFWAIVTGILEIVAAFVIRGFAAREWALGLASILSILFGILLIIRPGAGILAILWLVGIYSIIFGILFIVRAVNAIE